MVVGFLKKKASPLALYFGCYFGWHLRWLISVIRDRCQRSLGVEWRYWQGSPVTVLSQYQNYLYFATFHKTLFPTLSAAQYEYGNIIFNIEWPQIKDLLIIINQSQRCIIVLLRVDQWACCIVTCIDVIVLLGFWTQLKIFNNHLISR